MSKAERLDHKAAPPADVVEDLDPLECLRWTPERAGKRIQLTPEQRADPRVQAEIARRIEYQRERYWPTWDDEDEDEIDLTDAGNEKSQR